MGAHPIPFRTRKLSPPGPMVLGPQGPGRVGRCRIKLFPVDFIPRGKVFLYIIILYLIYVKYAVLKDPGNTGNPV